MIQIRNTINLLTHWHINCRQNLCSNDLCIVRIFELSWFDFNIFLQLSHLICSYSHPFLANAGPLMFVFTMHHLTLHGISYVWVRASVCIYEPHRRECGFCMYAARQPWTNGQIAQTYWRTHVRMYAFAICDCHMHSHVKPCLHFQSFLWICAAKLAYRSLMLSGIGIRKYC